MENEKIEIGEISKPKGLKGYLKILSYFDDLEVLLERVEEVFLKLGRRVKKHKIEDFYKKKGRVFIVKLSDINDIDTAQILRGVRLLVELKDFYRYYEESDSPVKYIGYRVIDYKTNEILGYIVDVQPMGKQRIFRCVTEDEDKEFFIPIQDEIFKEINRENKEIYIDNKGFNEI